MSLMPNPERAYPTATDITYREEALKIHPGIDDKENAPPDAAGHERLIAGHSIWSGGLLLSPSPQDPPRVSKPTDTTQTGKAALLMTMTGLLGSRLRLLLWLPSHLALSAA